MSTALRAAILSALPLCSADAGEWRFGLGPSYASGVRDVVALYEDNFNAVNTYAWVESKLLLPVGIAFAADYHWDSGVRVDLGFGPLFFVTGDAGNHTEIPVGLTVGYTFFPKANTSPYVRAGMVHHFVSGDYYQSTSPGLLAAAGIEFARNRGAKVVLEAMLDDSAVEFDSYTRTTAGVLRRSTKKLNTYDTVINLVVKF